MWKRLRGRRRAWLLIIPVVLVAAAATGWWLLTRDTTAAASSSTATVARETVTQSVSADGTVEAAKSRDESFEVSGTVTSVAVDEGDTVRKGQVLATVDRTTLVASRNAADSSLDAALAQLDDDLDAGASDVQVAADRTAVVAARATLEDAERAVDGATLRATIAGTVTSVSISTGDTVGSGTTPAATDTTDTTSGSISIVSAGSFVVEASVAAEDVGRLRKGMQVELAVTGVDEAVYGTVSDVGLVAQTNDSGAAVFPVTVEVTGTRDDLYAGVSATASIIVKQVPDVLTVVSRALTTEDGTTYATVLVDGEEVETEVETGEVYGMSTEVLSGLEEGDEVVVPGFTLPEGGGGDGGEGPQNFVFPGGGDAPPGLSEMGPPQ